MGTRRLEEMIDDARSQAYAEDYSLTEGWDNNVVARLFTQGLNKIYHAITSLDNPAHIQQYSTDSIASQQAYDIPIDVFMALRLHSVRYVYGDSSYNFIELEQGLIEDRFDYPTSYPNFYILRNSQILLSPTPSQTRTNAIVVNYQKRMRSIDVRRGLLSSKTDSPVTITLTFSISSSKNAEMEEYSTKLDKVDYICLVDRDGNPIVSAIPVDNYDSSTKVITAESSYSFPAAELAALDAAIAAGSSIYVVIGKYASSHSELDTQCEDYLIDYVIAQLLRLQSNSSEYKEALARETQIMNALITAYRRYRKTIYPIRWKGGINSRLYPWRRRGYY